MYRAAKITEKFSQRIEAPRHIIGQSAKNAPGFLHLFRIHEVAPGGSQPPKQADNATPIRINRDADCRDARGGHGEPPHGRQRQHHAKGGHGAGQRNQRGNQRAPQQHTHRNQQRFEPTKAFNHGGQHGRHTGEHRFNPRQRARCFFRADHELANGLEGIGNGSADLLRPLVQAAIGFDLFDPAQDVSQLLLQEFERTAFSNQAREVRPGITKVGKHAIPAIGQAFHAATGNAAPGARRGSHDGGAIVLINRRAHLLPGFFPGHYDLIAFGPRLQAKAFNRVHFATASSGHGRHRII